jgi:hypothetical protein
MARRRAIRAAALVAPIVPWAVACKSPGDVIVSTPSTQTIGVVTSGT